MIWVVDVWHSTTRPPRKEDWRRYRVEADDATEAELIACQIACAVHGHAVESTIIEWEEP